MPGGIPQPQHLALPRFVPWALLKGISGLWVLLASLQRSQCRDHRGCPPLWIQGRGRQHGAAGHCQQPHLESPEDTPGQPGAGACSPVLAAQAGTMAHFAASAPENPPAPLGLRSRRLWLILPLALEGQVVESPVARTPRAGNSPRLLGTALRKDLELQGAAVSPAATTFPATGCSLCFWRALCLPTMGAGTSISSWSLAKQPWERQVFFHGKVLQEEIPLWPAQPHHSPGPWWSIVSPGLWGCDTRTVPCLLPCPSQSLAVPTPVHREPSPRTSKGIPCKRGSPKAGLPRGSSLIRLSYR